MNADFSRILILLRKEKGISQKQAASQLNVSQALLSHYEKGIRECGLNFVVRAADFYDVSCDYLLGRSPQRNGARIHVEELPDEQTNQDKPDSKSLMAILNKKLIVNSVNILFDLLAKSNNKSLINEVSTFLTLSVYRMFRVVFRVNKKNNEEMFTIPRAVCSAKAAAQMQVSEANAYAIAESANIKGIEPIKSPENVLVNSDILAQNYPMYSSSLLNMVQTCENKINDIG